MIQLLLLFVLLKIAFGDVILTNESLFFCFFFLNFILSLNLKHCISFAKHQNESATGF